MKNFYISELSTLRIQNKKYPETDENQILGAYMHSYLNTPSILQNLAVLQDLIFKPDRKQNLTLFELQLFADSRVILPVFKT